jgi:acyl-CoA thioesterase
MDQSTIQKNVWHQTQRPMKKKKKKKKTMMMMMQPRHLSAGCDLESPRSCYWITVITTLVSFGRGSASVLGLVSSVLRA